jgi:hypothetical protein
MGNSDKLIVWALLGAALAGCGKDSGTETRDRTAEGEDATLPASQAGNASPAESVSTECGKGGSDCPAGLECLTWQGGRQACGPMAIDASVLIRDMTLGGRCAFPTPADSYPGTSLASVQIIGVDGKVKGFGRMLWDQSGFEVAAERGTPPNGSEFTGDACTESYNLGCDGQAVFEIIDGAGEAQKLREGEKLIVHLRGQKACGEEVADEIDATICNNPKATTSGDLSSCTSKVRVVEARSDVYGPDRVGGTLQNPESP